MRLTRKVNDEQLKEAIKIGEPFVREYEESDYCELEGTCDRDRLNKLGQLEDVLDKYYLESAEDLDIELKGNREKVYKYEILEKELDIDLITLFKVLTDKNNQIYVKRGKKIIKGVNIDLFQGFKTWYLHYIQPEGKSFVKTKDYGKTWALTKSELQTK